MGLDDNVFHFLLEETLFARKELRELGAKICIAGVKKKKTKTKNLKILSMCRRKYLLRAKGRKSERCMIKDSFNGENLTGHKCFLRLTSNGQTKIFW